MLSIHIELVTKKSLFFSDFIFLSESRKSKMNESVRTLRVEDYMKGYSEYQSVLFMQIVRI